MPRICEPKQYKKDYKRLKARSPKLALADLKQGTWLIKPYWDAFKYFFKHKRISWQMLMKAWGYANVYFLKWAEDELTWEEAFNKFEEALNKILEENEMMLRKQIQEFTKRFKCFQTEEGRMLF